MTLHRVISRRWGVKGDDDGGDRAARWGRRRRGGTGLGRGRRRYLCVVASLSRHHPMVHLSASRDEIGPITDQLLRPGNFNIFCILKCYNEEGKDNKNALL